LLFTSPWRSLELIRSIKIPILFFSGLKDQLIPPAQMKKLFSESKSDLKVMHEVPHGDHNNTVERGGIAYYERFRSFMQKVSGESKNETKSP